MYGFSGYGTNPYATRRLYSVAVSGNPAYITCNGADISSSIEWPSVDLLTVLTKEVSTLRFKVRLSPGQTTPAKTIPNLNDTIFMYDSSGKIFGGTVTEREATIKGLLITYEI